MFLRSMCFDLCLKYAVLIYSNKFFVFSFGRVSITCVNLGIALLIDYFRGHLIRSQAKKNEKMNRIKIKWVYTSFKCPL